MKMRCCRPNFHLLWLPLHLSRPWLLSSRLHPWHQSLLYLLHQ